jgi:hypothetical protein
MPIATTTLITLRLNAGTLYATPNAGHVRATEGTVLTWTANFPFTVEFAALTGNFNLSASAAPCSSVPSGHSYSLTLPIVADDTDPPSYKYTIKGDATGEAAGKVLDPIIIVDKRPHA